MYMISYNIVFEKRRGREEKKTAKRAINETSEIVHGRDGRSLAPSSRENVEKIYVLYSTADDDGLVKQIAVTLTFA